MPDVKLAGGFSAKKPIAVTGVSRNLADPSARCGRHLAARGLSAAMGV